MGRIKKKIFISIILLIVLIPFFLVLSVKVVRINYNYNPKVIQKYKQYYIYNREVNSWFDHSAYAELYMFRWNHSRMISQVEEDLTKLMQSYCDEYESIIKFDYQSEKISIQLFLDKPCENYSELSGQEIQGNFERMNSVEILIYEEVGKLYDLMINLKEVPDREEAWSFETRYGAGKITMPDKVEVKRGHEILKENQVVCGGDKICVTPERIVETTRLYMNGKLIRPGKEYETVPGNIKIRTEKKGEYYAGEVEALKKFAMTGNNNKFLNWKLDRPETWDGVKWTEEAGVFRVKTLDLKNLKIEGELDLREFSNLEKIDMSGSEIRLVWLPDSLKKIGNGAFQNCGELQYIQMGTMLEEIGEAAFSGCKRIYAGSFNRNLKKVGKKAFENCRMLEKIKFEGVPPFAAGENVFHGTSLNLQIEYPTDIEEWDEDYEQAYVMKGTKEWSGSKYNDDDLDYIEKILDRSKYNAVYDVRKWRNVTWGKNWKNEWRIVTLDLSKCKDITGTLDLSVFTELESVSLKGMKISKVILPDSLKVISEHDFDNCKELEEVIIPESVETIYAPAFSGCQNLKKVVFNGDAPQVVDESSSGIAEKVFGKTAKDFTIYRKGYSRGWQEICWEGYHIEEIG